MEGCKNSWYIYLAEVMSDSTMGSIQQLNRGQPFTKYQIERGIKLLLHMADPSRRESGGTIIMGQVLV